MTTTSNQENDESDKELRQRIAADQKAMDAQAYEILGHLHSTLLATPPIKLHDGTQIRFSEMQSPIFTQEGELTSSFDVDLPNGAFVEFSITKTGHGRPVPRYADLLKEQDRDKKLGR
jgi:hypothetical protein